MKIFIEGGEVVKGLDGMAGGSLLQQFISREEIQHFSKNGGNALGIRQDEGPLFGECTLVPSKLLWRADKLSRIKSSL